MTNRAKFCATFWTLALAACARPSARPEPSADLRIVSWNIQAGGKGIDSIAAVIRSLSPDVVGLQEVDVHWSTRSGFADQASELAARTGMRVLFAPIYSLDPLQAGTPRREFGVALLTRHGVVRWKNDSLMRLSTQTTSAVPAGSPGLLDAILSIGGREVRFLTTHLDYRGDPSVRRQQVAEIVATLRAVDVPTLLVGDMNASPDAAELAPMLSVLRDAWSRGVGEGLTYPAEKPAKRIDYVLASPHFAAMESWVVNTTVSDHRPVVARLRLP